MTNGISGISFDLECGDKAKKILCLNVCLCFGKVTWGCRGDTSASWIFGHRWQSPFPWTLSTEAWDTLLGKADAKKARIPQFFLWCQPYLHPLLLNQPLIATKSPPTPSHSAMATRCSCSGCHCQWGRRSSFCCL